jgi:alpha-tubulin suppressor-like RCC1 family protein
MVVRGLLAVGLLAVACSSSPAGTAGPIDGGGRDVASDALSCTSPDVFCGGVCQHESVGACGASCTVCAQPATSHGQSACLDGQCQFQCDPGYDRCGTQSCCGNMTRGDVAQIAAGGETTCAVTTAGAVWCWGDDSYGALGDGNTGGQSSMPLPVMNLPSTAQRVVLGGHHTCALLAGGTLACWGNDTQGQLGDGQRNPRGTPVNPVGLGSGVTHVALGESHTCAVAQGGGVYCWGDNSFGQLGNTTAPPSSATPVAVTGLTGAVDVAAGTAFSCALLAAGQVECWGDGGSGQLGGAASSPTPVVVAMPSPVKALSAGAKHVCALTTAGGVVCWGADDVNQLGSAHGQSSATPVQVPMVSGVTVLTAGGNESCALGGGGAVLCWGADPVGDVGMGPSGPAVVPSLSTGVGNVGVVSGHGCAVTGGGAPKCWGDNASGDLGDGTMSASWVPIDVTGV